MQRFSAGGGVTWTAANCSAAGALSMIIDLQRPASSCSVLISLQQENENFSRSRRIDLGLQSLTLQNGNPSQQRPTAENVPSGGSYKTL